MAHDGNNHTHRNKIPPPKGDIMDSYTKEELQEALRAVTSLIGKCEKAQEKLKQGTSQWSLLKNRIKAFHISSDLITKALEDK